MGRIISVNVSRKKGAVKQPVAVIELFPDLGVKDDAHAAPGDRQVSLLMLESIRAAKKMPAEKPVGKTGSKPVELGPGSFAENLTTEGLDLLALRIGDELRLSGGARLRVSKIGKECPRPCAIYYQLGDCLMPKQGIFCEVIVGGAVRPGDEIEKG